MNTPSRAYPFPRALVRWVRKNQRMVVAAAENFRSLMREEVLRELRPCTANAAQERWFQRLREDRSLLGKMLPGGLPSFMESWLPEALWVLGVHPEGRLFLDSVSVGRDPDGVFEADGCLLSFPAGNLQPESARSGIQKLGGEGVRVWAREGLLRGDPDRKANLYHFSARFPVDACLLVQGILDRDLREEITREELDRSRSESTSGQKP